MAEYIKRSDAIKAVNGQNAFTMTRGALIDVLNEIPTADVVPVVHGKWEYIPQTLNTLSQLRCPFCGWWSLDPSIDGAYNYCPECGAHMMNGG